MKKKRLISFFLCFWVCVTLVACNGEPIETPNASTTENSTVDGQTGTVDVQTLRTGNWNTAKTAGGDYDRRFLPGEGGFYCLIDGYLRFYDPSSNISVTLCQKVGCLHENGQTSVARKECEANLGAEMIFAYEGGYIYYDKEEHGQPQLYRRSADGTGEKHIAALCESYSDNKHTVQMESYFISDGVLYYTLSVASVQPDQNGTLVQTTEYRALIRMDLSNRKAVELLRVNNASISITAAKKDAVVYSTMDLSYYEAPLSDRTEAMLNTPRCYYLWTKEANASRELLCKPMKECSRSISFDLGVIIALESKPPRYYSYDFVTGEQQYLDRPGDTKLNDNIYFDDVSDTFCDAAGKKYPNELLDLSGTKYNDLQISILAQGENGLILVCRYSAIGEPNEQGVSTVTASATVCSYVPYEALTDGLQIQDVTNFLSWEETYD